MNFESNNALLLVQLFTSSQGFVSIDFDIVSKSVHCNRFESLHWTLLPLHWIVLATISISIETKPCYDIENWTNSNALLDSKFIKQSRPLSRTRLLYSFFVQQLYIAISLAILLCWWFLWNLLKLSRAMASVQCNVELLDEKWIQQSSPR